MITVLVWLFSSKPIFDFLYLNMLIMIHGWYS